MTNEENKFFKDWILNGERLKAIYKFLKSHPGPFIFQEFNIYSEDCYYEYTFEELLHEENHWWIDDPVILAGYIYKTAIDAAHNVYERWYNNHFGSPDYEDIEKNPKEYLFNTDLLFESRLKAADGECFCVTRLEQTFSVPLGRVDEESTALIKALQEFVHH